MVMPRVIAAFLALCCTVASCSRKVPVDVKVAHAKAVSIPLTVDFQATIFPARQANITARVVAPIRRVYVHEGDPVVAGQLLAVLDDRDLLASREEALAAVEEARSTLQKDRSTIRPLLGMTEQPAARGTEDRLKAAQDRLEEINAQIAHAEIRSPFSGTITDQLQYAGDMASSSAPVFTLMDMSTVTARGQATAGSASRLSSGQPCTFRADKGNTGSATGRLRVIRASKGTRPSGIPIWCAIPNESAQLRAGTTGTVVVETGGSTNRVVVPASAVQSERNGQRHFVFLVDSANIAHKQAVDGRDLSPTQFAITAGVAAGQIVVVDKASNLAEGTAVRF